MAGPPRLPSRSVCIEKGDRVQKSFVQGVTKEGGRRGAWYVFCKRWQQCSSPGQFYK